MYLTLLALHSALRWLVLIMLLIAIYRGLVGILRPQPFSNSDNALRHWTATSAHVQLILGLLLYFQSPVTAFFRQDPVAALKFREYTFFGLIHLLMMVIAIVILTVGSALAKRRATDREKFRTMLIWFSVALLVILIAIPWPFSPLAERPLLRPLP